MANYRLDTERLRKCREKMGISKMEAAKIVGLSQPAYLRYESGERTPSLQVVEKIADVFHTSVGYLIGETDLEHMNVYNIKETEEPELFKIVERCCDFDEKQLVRVLKYIEKLDGNKDR